MIQRRYLLLSHAWAVYLAAGGGRRTLRTGAVNMCCFKQAMGNPVHLNDAGEPQEQIRIAAPVDALQRLIQEHDDPASLLELYYWSKEPGLLECMRAFLQAPAEVRTILQDLLPATAASDKWSDG